MELHNMNTQLKRTKTLVILLLGFFSFTSFASNNSDGYEIEVKINGFTKDTLFLGYHYGSTQYLKDTVTANNKGTFVFKGDEELPGGIYMIILPPDNVYFELMIAGQDDQKFSVETDISDLSENIKIKGSKENENFYNYLSFVKEKGVLKQQLQEKEKTETNTDKLASLHAQIDQLDVDVRNYQNNLVKSNPGSLLGRVISMTLPVDVPDPKIEMNEQEESNWRFRYYKSHFFDGVDFTDDRILRTPLFQSKISTYIERLTVNHPDSIIIAVDEVLSKTSESEELFKFTLVHYLNKYAKSKIVGMDAVYVHLVDNYYAVEKAPWVSAESLEKMKKRAKELRPLLIGKQAPNIRLRTYDGERYDLYDLKSPYTVLYFWDPKCGHCTKAAPLMNEFYENYKDKGVQIYSVCTKDKEVEKCAQTVIEKGFTDWINVYAKEDVDLYYRYFYSIKTTPVIYILGEDKTILSKNIGAKQLPEVLDMLIKNKQAGSN